MSLIRVLIIALVLVALAGGLDASVSVALAQGFSSGGYGPGGGTPAINPTPKKKKKKQAPTLPGEEKLEEGLLAELGLPSGKQIKRKFMTMIGRGPDEEIARKAFAEGDELFRAGEYEAAMEKYELAEQRWPDSSLEEDAMFMTSECHFFMNKYPAASDTYAEILRKYDNSRHLDTIIKRQFAIARYWEEKQEVDPNWTLTPNVTDRTRPLFDTPGNALAIYQSVHLYDPTGPLADDSLMATANAHFLAGRYEDADYYYGLVRNEYPQSEHQAAAHLLGIKSKLRKYQGPSYDGTPLKEADELIQQTLIQFPHELAHERERLVHTRQSVRAQLAERDWNMGEYFHKNGHYGSARFYYNLVVSEFPETRYADVAQVRLDETADSPENPPEDFQWLSNLLDWDKKLR